MRNLKKVLSLVLALAMMLSMMAFASAAEKKTITSADLTDMDQVQNKAAVSLLVDLGILNGIEQEDGTFKYEPAMGINRASWAKMVYYVMTGEADASAYKGLSLGLKDVAGHWAEGEIAYCVANKIASGDLEKNFYPDADITVVGAAKMLLTALGYDATLSKYENDQLWSLNIMNDAKRAGIMVGINQAANEVLSRDNAALMVYNALNARTVDPDVQYDMGVAYLDGYEYSFYTLGEQIYGLAKVTGVVTGLEGGKADVTLVGDTNYGLDDDQVDFFAGNADLLGQTVSFFIQINLAEESYIKTWSSALIADGSSLVASSTSGIAHTVLTTKPTSQAPNPFYVGAEAETPKVFLNGKLVNDVDVTLDGADATKGNLVELYDTNGNGKIDVVKVTAYTIGAVRGPVEVKTGPDGKTSVTVPGVEGKSFVGYEGLEPGDVVLTYEVDGVTYIEKAEVVTTVAAGKNSDEQVLINGEYLGLSGLASASWGEWDDDFLSEYNFYLDKSGSVLTAAATTVKVPDKYLYVLASAYVEGQGLNATSYLEAQVIHPDGTIEVITIEKAVANGAAVDLTEEEVLVGEFYTYADVNENGKYELVAKTGDDDAISGNVSGKVDFVGDGSFLANTKTTFLVAIGNEDDGWTYSVHTGYANLPDMDNATGVAMVDEKSGMATLVFLSAAETKGTTSALSNVYLLDTDTFTYVVENGQVVALSTSAVVNGEVTTIKVPADAAEALKALEVGFYNIKSVDDKGVAVVTAENFVSITDNVKSGIAAKDLTIANGVIKTGETVFSYNDATVLYLIDTQGAGSVTEMAVDSFKAGEIDTYTMYVIADENNPEYAVTVYLVK